MNLRIVRLIAGREFRDLLRDRRSVLLLLLLPMLLYPGFGLVGLMMGLSLSEQKSTIGIVGSDSLPATVTGPNADPPLLIEGQIDPRFGDLMIDAHLLTVVRLSSAEDAALEKKLVDAVLIVPADAREKWTHNSPVTVDIKNREGDELSKLAASRLKRIVRNYDDALREARFRRQGLPVDFDRCMTYREPKEPEALVQRTSDELRDQLAKFFPFMLVMWALAGALHPAIDLCAGEKERGTMETLLISPAERTEIVAGKFLAVWFYATLTAWWNLAWMGGLCLVGRAYFGVDFVRPMSLVVCYLLVTPLTAMFAALCLALGVYARSTKEGQYYLLPLFLGALPLVLLSLLPNMELTWLTSLIPITGLCLVMQKLIGPTAWSETLPFLLPVFGGLTVCVVLSIWWAVRQFHREDVLFREADAVPFRGWLASFNSQTAD